ncbi:MAG: phenylalanine--tRNA ligase subunit beta, partial [bacterium]|nr:phenylalanine--tRNA ligase subunit beta [bacterium]
EGVEHIAIGARGLIAARVDQVEPLPGKRELHRAVLDVGSGAPVETVTAAAELTAGALVVYAPVGAHLAEVGEVGTAKVGAHQSNGMIVSGEMVGIAMAAEQAVFLPPYTVPGAALDPALFDDWVIEVDNKSITHRPDLWGHYGIAREIAAILGKPLGEYPVVDLATLTENDQPTIPIEIDAPEACARYSGLRMDCVASQPAPLWMQLRLGHVGLRPIDCLVDLTNYIMLELGQPMHAFDGDHIERIEVAWAEPGSKFTTLDGFERQMPERALMIMSDRQPVAVAGIMGGLATEVSPHTKSMLLESANFDAATVRRCTTALGLRTDASARFEKSLDPANTVMALRRFVHLAKPEFPELKLTSPLSDCYPRQAEAVEVEINVPFINGFMGHAVSNDEIAAILTPLGFGVNDQGERMTIQVPSWRATKDVAMEADIIEEVARCVGYDNIDSRLPRATVRCFDANAQHEVEQNTLREFCMNLGYNEIHRYLWYNDAWLAKLGYSPVPGIEVRNPITAQEHSLRH